jgi:hypothetical protein
MPFPQSFLSVVWLNLNFEGGGISKRPLRIGNRVDPAPIFPSIVTVRLEGAKIHTSNSAALLYTIYKSDQEQSGRPH